MTVVKKYSTQILLSLLAIIICVLFFLPKIPSVNKTSEYSVDTIGNMTIWNKQRPLGILSVKRKKIIEITGWAADEKTNLPASSVIIMINGISFPAEYGLARTDVAKALKIPEYKFTGFRVAIPANKAGKGKYMLWLMITSNDGKKIYRSEETFRFRLTNP